MEAVGVPIDQDMFRRLQDAWEAVREQLIERVDRDYGVFQKGKFNARLWQRWVNHHQIRWPRLPGGLLDLRLPTFRDMAVAYPEVRPMAALQASLSQLRQFRLAVGSDGRNRCPLRPFSSKTGRNQPSTNQFIFGPAVWLRGLIKPLEDMAVAYVDYEQQEFGIAAALSQDQAMMDAYASGDPYLTLAKQARAVPADATKRSHNVERQQFKQAALAVQYGMGAHRLASRLGASITLARDLLRLHRRTYARYWAWSDAVQQTALEQGKLQAAFGWTLTVTADANPRSVRNFPLQANGAEILRLACCSLTERGVRVCAPVHDALLVEAPIGDIEAAVTASQEAMAAASAVVLRGFRLRTEAKVVRAPERFMDERGRKMWELVVELLGSEGDRRCASVCCRNATSCCPGEHTGFIVMVGGGSL